MGFRDLSKNKMHNQIDISKTMNIMIAKYKNGDYYSAHANSKLILNHDENNYLAWCYYGWCEGQITTSSKDGINIMMDCISNAMECGLQESDVVEVITHSIIILQNYLQRLIDGFDSSVSEAINSTILSKTYMKYDASIQDHIVGGLGSVLGNVLTLESNRKSQVRKNSKIFEQDYMQDINSWLKYLWSIGKYEAIAWKIILSIKPIQDTEALRSKTKKEFFTLINELIQEIIQHYPSTESYILGRLNEN